MALEEWQIDMEATFKQPKRHLNEALNRECLHSMVSYKFSSYAAWTLFFFMVSEME